jgi:tryptophan synthase alpha chain
VRSSAANAVPELEKELRARRDGGRKLLIPYLMGGMTDDWGQSLAAVVAAGADAVEVGIPFSDPMIDGPVIQEAALRALQRGTVPQEVLDGIARAEAPVPIAVMTYYNIVFRGGHERFAHALVGAGISAVILPDAPLEELGEWRAAAQAAGVETVLLAAPVTPDDRLALLCRQAEGFVYGINLMGVTGERAALAETGGVLAKRLKAVTDKPVLMGLGVSTPEQAVEAASLADGVVVGSALVRKLLEGGGPEGAAAFVASLRAALDAPTG